MRERRGRRGRREGEEEEGEREGGRVCVNVWVCVCPSSSSSSSLSLHFLSSYAVLEKVVYLWGEVLLDERVASVGEAGEAGAWSLSRARSVDAKGLLDALDAVGNVQQLGVGGVLGRGNRDAGHGRCTGTKGKASGKSTHNRHGRQDRRSEQQERERERRRERREVVGK